MRSVFFIAFAFGLGCTDVSSPPSSLPRCGSFPTEEIACSTDGACSWRGAACELDECGMPPAYPGYAASPQGEYVSIRSDQWTALAAWITAERTFQKCESASR